MDSITLQTGIEHLSKTAKPAKYTQSLKDANVLTVENLLWVYPKSIKTIPPIAPFTQAKEDHIFHGVGEILSIKRIPLRNNRKKFLMNLHVEVKDILSHKKIKLFWFNSYPSVMKKLQSLNKISFIGVVNKNNTSSIANPKFSECKGLEKPVDNNIEIEYPVLNKVQGHYIEKLISKIPHSFYQDIPDFLPSELKKKNRLVDFSKAIKFYHCLPMVREIWNKEEYAKAKERLVYEEIFWEQMKLSSQKYLLSQHKSPIINWEENDLKVFLNQLPFTLTESQSKVLSELQKDLSQGAPMHRILQGDVGCGKTIVAIIAATMVAAKGFQVAILCPTEGLANQFYKNVNSYNFLNFESDLIVGGPLNKFKKNQLKNLENGITKIVVGTHALIQNKINFQKLGLSIIDEQHKFGVKQRNKLIDKSPTKHFLLMSATPIPRSLGLTVFGNLDISTISEMPNKNKKISTKIITHELRSKMLSFILTRISMGEQIYIVAPLIEESEHQNLINLKEIFHAYKKLFPKISMAPLHGRMNADEKNAVLQSFKQNKISILVSTTVIEVGIDVPNSTVMVIYNPERFGLSSLHQLRGRVGRGNKPGFCFLDCLQNISHDSKKRLEKFLQCKDGFDIAETDLELRGPGDFIGNTQSGHIVKRKISNPIKDFRTLVKVKNDITYLADKFPADYQKCLDRISKEKLLSPV